MPCMEAPYANIGPGELLGNFPIRLMADHLRMSDRTLAVCEEYGYATIRDIRRALRVPMRVRRITQGDPDLELELFRLIEPHGTPLDWPPHPVPHYRARQTFAHLNASARSVLCAWVDKYEDPWTALRVLIHANMPLLHLRGAGPARIEELNNWRREMRRRIPPPSPPLEVEQLRYRWV